VRKISLHFGIRDACTVERAGADNYKKKGTASAVPFTHIVGR
jgi:hypothetical protein